jgi:hypothetical protein
MFICSTRNAMTISMVAGRALNRANSRRIGSHIEVLKNAVDESVVAGEQTKTASVEKVRRLEACIK